MDSPGRGRSRPVFLACPACRADGEGCGELPLLLPFLLLPPGCAPLLGGAAWQGLLKRPVCSAVKPLALLGPAPQEPSRSLLPCRHAPLWPGAFSLPARSRHCLSCTAAWEYMVERSLELLLSFHHEHITLPAHRY